MDNLKTPDQNSGDVSSDGEEDFESADEGESKEKASNASAKGDVSSAIYSKNSVGRSNKESEHTDRGNGDVPEGVTNLNIGDNDAETHSDTSVEKAIDVESSHDIADSSTLSPGDSDTGTSAKTHKDIAEAQDTREKMDSPNGSSRVLESSGDVEYKEHASSSEDNAQSNESSNVTAESGSSGWGWGSWGAVLNQATSTMTSGLSQVIEKVETTLGIPEPGELQDEASASDEKKEVITMEPKSVEIDRDVEESNGVAGSDTTTGDSESFFSSWGLTSLSNAVTNKGRELVSGGIDALETIGKKTMDVISDGDPGFRGKREMFKKPTLSQVLREAKEESAREAAEKKTQEALEKVNFNDEFDRCQGLAHLEALEILSRECEAKIESVLIDLFEDDLEQAKMKLRAIEDVFGRVSPSDEEREESENAEFAVEIGRCAMALNLAFVPNKLNQIEESISKWLVECKEDQKTSISSRTPDDIFAHVITSLADVTAKSIEVFRKVAEMILLVDDEENTVSAEDRATHLSSLTRVVTNRISSLSTSYAECLNTAVNETEDNDNITPLITEVYLECSNSSSHVQDAFKLLQPVLQVSALNSMKT